MACVFELLLMIITANSTPVIARNVLKHRFDRPIDGGTILADGNPLFGRSKTWRGLIAATLATSAVALLLGLPVWIGAVAGLSAMAGDLIASFIKRRRGIQPSGRAIFLDAVPEALLPALLLRTPLGMNWMETLLLIAFFTVLVPLTSPLLYRLHIRRHPW